MKVSFSSDRQLQAVFQIYIIPPPPSKKTTNISCLQKRHRRPDESKLTESKYSMNRPCLVPKPPIFVAVEPFRVTWSERSSRLRHRNGLTVKAWEKAVQELGKNTPSLLSLSGSGIENTGSFSKIVRRTGNRPHQGRSLIFILVTQRCFS